MTLGPAAHSIGTVSSWTSASSRTSAPAAGPIETARLRPMLTKRRAVDFCRVATALCQVARGSDRPVASRSCAAAGLPGAVVLRIRPLVRCQTSPVTTATASAAMSAMTPGGMPC